LWTRFSEEEKLEDSQLTEGTILKTPSSDSVSGETTPRQNDSIENGSSASQKVAR